MNDKISKMLNNSITASELHKARKNTHMAIMYCNTSKQARGIINALRNDLDNYADLFGA